jgi:hypothetical protein
MFMTSGVGRHSEEKVHEATPCDLGITTVPSHRFGDSGVVCAMADFPAHASLVGALFRVPGDCETKRARLLPRPQSLLLLSI